MKLVWLFGLVSKEISREEKAAEGKPEPGRRRVGAKTVFLLLRTRGLLEQLKSLLKDILGCFKIRHLVANFRVGLDDPADTGLFFAFVGPVAHFLNSSFSHEIRVQPAFDKAVFEGFSHGTVKLRPIRLFPPLLRFAFSLATLRVAKGLILTKWKRRK